MARDGKSNRSDCGTSKVLELIGDKWCLIIVRECIFLGRREYSQFLDMPEGISSNILAAKLKWLTEIGVFTKNRHPTHKRKQYYEITDKGFDLVMIIMEMAKWSWDYIPGSFTPPEIKELYLADPKRFKKIWKQKVRKMSEAYLKEAMS